MQCKEISKKFQHISFLATPSGVDISGDIQNIVGIF